MGREEGGRFRKKAEGLEGELSLKGRRGASGFEGKGKEARVRRHFYERSEGRGQLLGCSPEELVARCLPEELVARKGLQRSSVPHSL
jgi:hypothetical protein